MLVYQRVSDVELPPKYHPLEMVGWWIPKILVGFSPNSMWVESLMLVAPNSSYLPPQLSRLKTHLSNPNPVANLEISTPTPTQPNFINPRSPLTPLCITQVLTMDSAKVLKAPTYSKSHTMRMPRKARASRMERTRRSCPVLTEEDKITAR